MKTKLQWRNALDLIQHQPGAFERRQELVLALCHNQTLTGQQIVATANEILEAELNLAPRPKKVRR